MTQDITIHLPLLPLLALLAWGPVLAIAGFLAGSYVTHRLKSGLGPLPNILAAIQRKDAKKEDEDQKSRYPKLRA